MATEEQMRSALDAKRRIKRWKGKLLWKIHELLDGLDEEAQGLAGRVSDQLSFDDVEPICPRRKRRDDGTEEDEDDDE